MTSCWRNFGQWYGITVEVWEWISNFILHMTRHVITYSRWEQSKSMFVKGPQLYELTHFNPVMLYGIGDFRQPRDRCWIAASLHQSIAWTIAWTNAVSVSNFRENIYRSDAQVTFELYGHFKCLQSIIPNKTIYTKYCFTEWISKLLGGFEIHWVRQYLVNSRVWGA